METQWADITFVAVVSVWIYIFLKLHFAKHCIHTWEKVWSLPSKELNSNKNYYRNFNSLEVGWEDTEVETKVLHNTMVGDTTYLLLTLISKNWSKEKRSLSISLVNTFTVLGTEEHTSFPAGISSTIKDSQLKRIFFCCLNPNDEGEKRNYEPKTNLLKNKNLIFEGLLLLGACEQ